MAARRRAPRLRRGATAGATVGGLVAALALLPVDATVEAPFTVQAAREQVVAAPFDGIVEASDIEPGARVRAGETVLARLATRDIALELAAVRARAASDRREATIARAAGQPGQEQLALLSARRAEAQMALLEYRLRLAELRAPADGVVVGGDLRRSLGQPVSRGQTLFELALDGPLRAELLVLDERVPGLAPGQEVRLSPASAPGERLHGSVVRLRPAAEVVQNRNVVRVDVTLLDSPPDLRPGMEGVARVTTGRTTALAWLLEDPLRWLRRVLWV